LAPPVEVPSPVWACERKLIRRVAWKGETEREIEGEIGL
jgi:hypothetical protein